jgi:hypothetical protein
MVLEMVLGMVLGKVLGKVLETPLAMVREKGIWNAGKTSLLSRAADRLLWTQEQRGLLSSAFWSPWIWSAGDSIANLVG